MDTNNVPESVAKAQRERGLRDGQAGILPQENGRYYTEGFWEGRKLLRMDPMTLWRRVNAGECACRLSGCNHH